MPWDEADVGDLQEEITELRARLLHLETRLDGRLDELSKKLDRKGKRGRAGDTLQELDLWVRTQLMPMIERRVSNTRRWCAQWYNHPEVLHRLRVLHRAWIEAYIYDDALEESKWWVEHLDKHFEVMLSADGPFAGCSPTRHSPSRPLDVRPMPPILYGARAPTSSGPTNNQSSSQQSPAEVT